MNRKGDPSKYTTTHPGEVLLDELKARKTKQKELASLMGVSPSQLNEVIKGKRGVGVDFAIKLEACLKIPALFWMNMQTGYDLTKAYRIKQP